MAKKKQVPLIPRVNREFPVHNGPCPWCGHESEEEGEDNYAMVCPTCTRDGCHECMPAGRGCECPECETGEDGR